MIDLLKVYQNSFILLQKAFIRIYIIVYLCLWCFFSSKDKRHALRCFWQVKFNQFKHAMHLTTITTTKFQCNKLCKQSEYLIANDFIHFTCFCLLWHIMQHIQTNNFADGMCEWTQQLSEITFAFSYSTMNICMCVCLLACRANSLCVIILNVNAGETNIHETYDDLLKHNQLFLQLVLYQFKVGLVVSVYCARWYYLLFTFRIRLF